MPKFFVWSAPSVVVVIEAESEQHAAEAFLEQPVTSIPIRGKQPACFVEPAEGRDAPGLDGEVTGFWISDEPTDG